MDTILEVSDTHRAVQYVAVNASEGAFSEAWLQETLRRYPEVLPIDEFGPAFHPLVCIGREVPTSAGPIDNLYISQSGYLVIVETKLWRNPEARREVVAQLIDYATALTKLTYQELDALVQGYLRRYEETSATSLEEWIEERVESVDAGFQGRVARNLRLGRFLLLIVTDQERPTVVEMLRRLSAQAWLSIDMGVVVLRPFRRTGDESSGLLLVPQIAGRTEIIERSAIEVTVVGALGAEIAVRRDRPSDEVASRSPLTSEIAFWELLRDKAPRAEGAARQLIDSFRHDAFEVRLGEGSLVVDAVVPGSDVTVPMFFIKKNGKLAFWPRTAERRARGAGVDESVVREYVTNMSSLLGGSPDVATYRAVQEVNIGALRDCVSRFSMSVQSQEAG